MRSIEVPAGVIEHDEVGQGRRVLLNGLLMAELSVVLAEGATQKRPVVLGVLA
jgi:hypothetical protein